MVFLDTQDSDVPLPDPETKEGKQFDSVSKKLIGIVYNLKKGILSDVPDIEAEYDNIETVHAISESLILSGYNTVLLEADNNLPEKLKKYNPDFVFNIAEGFAGRGREAQIPALLDMMAIPYTGSDETTLGIALDKSITKRLLSTYNIKSPKSLLLDTAKIKKDKKIKLKYPVIIKPNAEGSSKGISDISIVENNSELNFLVQQNINIYKCSMLAEEYIAGREFTVGILGNGENLQIFRPMEIVYKKKTEGDYNIYSYNVKQNYREYVEYVCPADIDKKIEEKIIKKSKKIFYALGCRDFARIDFRLSPKNKLYFIEINPLPGLAPGYSDYPMLAEFCGCGYTDLINNILGAALKRCGIEL